MVEQDYYNVLGVQRGADPETIKAAYRKLAKEHHPDRHNGCSEREAQFKAISEAYDCLKDPQKRAAYDRFGKAAFQNGGGGDPFGGAGFESFSDIFSSIFGEFADRERPGRPPVQVRILDEEQRRRQRRVHLLERILRVEGHHMVHLPPQRQLRVEADDDGPVRAHDESVLEIERVDDLAANRLDLGRQ